MESFKDTEGREWTLPELKLSHMMALNRELSIEINDVIEDGLLWNDTDAAWLTVGACCWQLCKEQHKVEEEQFFEAWDGDVFIAAQEAFARSVANFTQKRRREAILAMLDTMKRIRELLPKLSESQIGRIQEILNENVTSGLAKLASQTQEATVSAS